MTMHIVTIDLTVPGIRLRLTPPGGTRETVRQTTVACLIAQPGQLAVNIPCRVLHVAARLSYRLQSTGGRRWIHR
jgi:hypothetical protein